MEPVPWQIQQRVEWLFLIWFLHKNSGHVRKGQLRINLWMSVEPLVVPWPCGKIPKRMASYYEYLSWILGSFCQGPDWKHYETDTVGYGLVYLAKGRALYFGSHRSRWQNWHSIRRSRSPTSILPLMPDHFISTWKKVLIGLALGFKFWLAKTSQKISATASWKNICQGGTSWFCLLKRTRMKEYAEKTHIIEKKSMAFLCMFCTMKALN